MATPLDMTNVVDRLIGRFGSQARLAEAAGCSQSTIAERRARRSLTHRQMTSILAKAPGMGVAVAPSDFFEGAANAHLAEAAA